MEAVAKGLSNTKIPANNTNTGITKNPAGTIELRRADSKLVMS